MGVTIDQDSAKGRLSISEPDSIDAILKNFKMDDSRRIRRNMIMASLAPTERSEDTRGLLNVHTVKLPIDVAKSHVTQHFTQYDHVLSTLDHAYS